MVRRTQRSFQGTRLLAWVTRPVVLGTQPGLVETRLTVQVVSAMTSGPQAMMDGARMGVREPQRLYLPRSRHRRVSRPGPPECMMLINNKGLVFLTTTYRGYWMRRLPLHSPRYPLLLLPRSRLCPRHRFHRYRSPRYHPNP